MSVCVSSLLDLSLQTVMRDIKYHEAKLRYLPSLVKTKVAAVMAKRGLLTDSNLSLVAHGLATYGWVHTSNGRAEAYTSAVLQNFILHTCVCNMGMMWLNRTCTSVLDP